MGARGWVFVLAMLIGGNGWCASRAMGDAGAIRASAHFQIWGDAFTMAGGASVSASFQEGESAVGRSGPWEESRSSRFCETGGGGFFEEAPEAQRTEAGNWCLYDSQTAVGQ